MKGGNWRLLRSVVALSLPAAAVCALGVWFLVRDVPVLVAEEKTRVLSTTEQAAKTMRDDPSLADFVWKRGNGVVSGTAASGDFPPDMSWKEWGPEGGTKRRDMWGWRPMEGGRLVWARGVGKHDGETVYARRTDIRERDYALMFYVFGPLFMLVLVGVTFFGARFLARYAKERDDFVAATVHDLTTPLAALRLTIGRSEEESRLLVDRMVNLVRNLGDFLRLGGKRPPPERVPVDLVAACREAYAPYREDFRDHFGGEDVEISCTAPSAAATADPTLVAQTLWNLFGNELKYAAPFGRVKVRIEEGGGKVCVVFADEGPGMSPRDRRRAFDRYFRGRSKSGKGGFGIGLCTAREFARAMGGNLTLAANDPHGCVFTLELPK